MATAQYYVAQRRAQGYELVQVRPILTPSPWWVIGGTMLAWAGLRRRTLPGLAILAAGIALICRGSDQSVQWRRRVGYLPAVDDSVPAQEE
jgi:hypothetical protein